MGLQREVMEIEMALQQHDVIIETLEGRGSGQQQSVIHKVPGKDDEVSSFDHTLVCLILRMGTAWWRNKRLRKTLLFSLSHYYRPHPKDGGRYCFQFVSPHPGGGVTPCLGLNSLLYLEMSVCSLLGGRGVPADPTLYGGGGSRSSLDGWGSPDPALDGGGYPISGGVPHLRVPPPRNSKHLLRLHGGRCVSCVYAGGLSCFSLKIFDCESAIL